MFYKIDLRFRSLAAYGAAALLSILHVDAQNLILNGDFEAEPHDPFGSVMDWTTGGSGFVHSAMEGATSGTFSAALSIGSDSENNVLSQSFATVSGQNYVVELDAGIFGTRAGAPLRLNIQLTGAGTLIDQTITPPDAFTDSPDQVSFHHYRFFFTADGATTTLRFTDIGLGNADADTVVDTVSVMPSDDAIAPTTLPLGNADFEMGPFNLNGTVSGWTVTGASRIAVFDEGATSGSHSVVFGPGGDFQDDILSQRFFTTAGQDYIVDFDAAVYGVTDSSQMLRVRVVGGNGVLDQIVSPPYFATFDPGAIQFQHYHFVFTADSGVSTLEFSDIGFGNSDADVVVDSVSVARKPPTFAEWQASHFTPDQLGDQLISGWAADPDQDGIANGLEYFFGTDPLAGITGSDAISLPHISIEASGSSKYLTYTFRRLLGWPGNAATVGVSDDLVTWDETGNQIEFAAPVIPSGDGVTEVVKIRLKTPIAQGPIRKKFVRLTLTQ